jgi:hypothetical protein
MAGRLTLDQLVEVRILCPQPSETSLIGEVSGFSGKRLR